MHLDISIEFSKGFSRVQLNWPQFLFFPNLFMLPSLFWIILTIQCKLQECHGLNCMSLPYMLSNPQSHSLFGTLQQKRSTHLKRMSFISTVQVQFLLWHPDFSKVGIVKRCTFDKATWVVDETQLYKVELKFGLKSLIEKHFYKLRQFLFKFRNFH